MMNFELYRPTEIQNTFIESENGERYSRNSFSEDTPIKER